MNVLRREIRCGLPVTRSRHIVPSIIYKTTRPILKSSDVAKETPSYVAYLNGIAWTAILWSGDANAADPSGKRYGGFLAPISNALESVLNTLQDGLHFLHVPYSFGFSIILLTVIVKIVTFPFTKKQVESAMAMQSLKPRIDNIKLRYGEDKDKVRRETAILYEEAGVDPTAGCFPTLATIPILWGLFRTLSNVASEGKLDAEGFLWIPSLAGPTSIAARQAGTGLVWLWPFVNGAPPVGWEEASRYLVLPILLVILQYYSSSIISPVDPNDEGSKFTKYLLALLPLLVLYFSLIVPSGLTLYYFSNTVITTGQQYWLRKLGGADVELNELGPVTKLGMARRTGKLIEDVPTKLQANKNPEIVTENGTPAAEPGNGAQQATPVNDMLVRKRSKRTRRGFVKSSNPKKNEQIIPDAEIPA